MTTVQENKTVTDTVEVEGAALIELLEGAITHAHKDKSLLSLNAVQLEGEGAGYLVARATDRFRLITGKIEVESGQLSKSLIPLSDVKRVIELSKSNKLSRVTLNRIGDLLTISVTGSSITVQLLEANYPDFTTILDKIGRELDPQELSFNPALFADYAKIAGKGKAVRVEFTGLGRPMIIHLPITAVEWTALLMPMRTI
jgi:DNA polymerase III sliding clamp (beta) subunit (PCNA family)